MRWGWLKLGCGVDGGSWCKDPVGGAAFSSSYFLSYLLSLTVFVSLVHGEKKYMNLKKGSENVKSS